MAPVSNGVIYISRKAPRGRPGRRIFMYEWYATTYGGGRTGTQTAAAAKYVALARHRKIFRSQTGLDLASQPGDSLAHSTLHVVEGRPGLKELVSDRERRQDHGLF